MDHDRAEILQRPGIPEIYMKRAMGVEAFANYGIAILDRGIANTPQSPEVSNYEAAERQRMEALRLGDQALNDQADRLRRVQNYTPEQIIAAAEKIVDDEARRVALARQNVEAAVNPLVRGANQ